MSVTEYIGPIVAQHLEGEWSSTNSYESLAVVTNEGNSYTARQDVPVGIDITNTNYWIETGNWNAQIEAYRQEVLAYNARITSNTNMLAEIAPFDTSPTKNSTKGVTSEGVYTALQNMLYINTSPMAGYEGIITNDNVDSNVPACSAIIATNTIFQVFRDDNNENGIYKIILVNNSNENRVIAKGNIYNCGHANSCFYNDGYVYIITSGSTYAKYAISNYVSELYPSQTYTFDSLTNVGNIFYYDSTIYIATSEGNNQLSIYSVSNNTKTTLIAKNILPTSTVISEPMYTLRNDCTCDSYGTVYFALTNRGYNGDFNILFCYSLISKQYAIINLPQNIYIFNIGEIEGITNDVSTGAIYITTYTALAACVIIGIYPYVNVMSNGYIAKLPNHNAQIENIRYGTCDEETSIYQSGNTTSPLTTLTLAVAAYNYYANLFNQTKCNILMLNDMSETLNAIPPSPHFKLNLQSHTLTINSNNQVQSGYGRLFINNGKLYVPNGFTTNIRGQVTLDNIDLNNTNFYFGNCVAILRDVSNVTYRLQAKGNASLLFTVGNTPIYNS